MEVGLVHKIDIDSEMQQAYLDYAMSVIVARALPDARDGLKPVHRRILYAMYDMGLRAESTYKKSARIVGEVLGKYHPHGDMAVYDAMARMAQDFSMRYLLVDGQGNFGSVDGDPPAAMRYTEARLAPPAVDMLADIGKNTVNFEDNFDATLTEPTVLPAAIPNLLVNGATGIAVGMATSIPPHNLGEVVDGLTHMLENWEKLDEINVEDLMRFIQGPDFPTGGIIIQEPGEEGLTSAYGSGRGRVTMQASAHLEEMERGRNRIIVTELPYMTNKSSLIERIAELVRGEKLLGIVDLRDESDRQGMRIVIELSKTAEPEAVLRDLYKYTPMQSTFSIIMLALVDGEPRMLSLKQALRVYVEHRLEIVRRRSDYDLEKARSRAHILEGLRVALKNLDEVIDLIRKSPDIETARARLMKRFKLSELQAQAILDMPLRRLAALERKKIEEEYKEVLAQIKELEALLKSPKKMRGIVSTELLAVKQAFGDRRRTHIVRLGETQRVTSLLTTTDLTPEKTVWISVTVEGLVSRSLEDNLPRLSGKEAPWQLLRASTRDTLYLVGETGEAAALPVHAIPEAESPNAGLPIFKASALKEGSKLVGMFALPPKDRPVDRFILTASRQGYVKKSSLSELPGPSANTFTLVRVNEGDQLVCLRICAGKSDILMLTAQGMIIRFSEEEVRPMGLVAAGVMGIRLQEKDEVVGMDLLPQPGEVFMLASDGTAKRVPADHFSRQGRYGQGVIAWKLPTKAHAVSMAIGKGTARVIIHLSKMAPKTIRLDEATLATRTARGRELVAVRAGEPIVGLVVVPEIGGKGAARKSSAGEPSAGLESRPTGKAPVKSTKKTPAKVSPKSPPIPEKAIPKKGRKSPPTPERTIPKEGRKSPPTPEKAIPKEGRKSLPAKSPDKVKPVTTAKKPAEPEDKKPAGRSSKTTTGGKTSKPANKKS